MKSCLAIFLLLPCLAFGQSYKMDKLTLSSTSVTSIVTTIPTTPTSAQLPTAQAVKTYVDAQTGVTTATITVTTPTNNFVFGPQARPIKTVYRNGILQTTTVVVVQSTGTINFTINLNQNEQVSIVF